MASEAELRDLRLRAARILKSQACLDIRFQLDKVGIQTFMYSYIGSAISDDKVHLNIGTGHNYNPATNTITFNAIDVDAPTIVHEATHAIIDATHVGQKFTTGVHEAAAYLAETVYALNANYGSHQIDVPHLAPSLYDLARRIKAFNSQNKSGLFVCPASDTFSIIAILGNSKLGMDVDHTEVMDGINEAPHRGLLGHMALESRKK